MKKITSILLIDDDEEDKNFFREALQEVDNTVQYFEANNGQHALDMLNASNALLPDLIFLDLNMPVMDGKQCLQSIMRSKKLCHIPIIIYTTSHQQYDIDETKKLGASHFITKPIYFEDISRVIGEALEKKWDYEDHSDL
jgi:CheY-like chemotaxis protein